MIKNNAVVFLVLSVLTLAAVNCSGFGQNQAPDGVQGDTIATAVAGTLAAGQLMTVTAVAEVNETTAAQDTQTAAEAAAATAQAEQTIPVIETPGTAESTALLTPQKTPKQAAQVTPTPGLVPENIPESLIVAYTGVERDLWVWKDGQPRRLTTTGDIMEISISDDGEWIAFTRSTDFVRYSLWAIRPDGRDERELMNTTDFEALPHDSSAVTVVPLAIAWAPQSHTLAFSTRPTFEGPGLMLNDDLWVVDIDSGERRELLPVGEGGRFYYSPDGTQIALVKPDSISLIDADGSNRRDHVLDYPEVSTYSEYRFYAAPQWSPDSTFLRVVIPPPASLEHPEDSTTIWEIPVDGSPARQLGSVQTAALFFPVLSPDISRLAYLRSVGDPAENQMELHIADVDGTNDHVYLTDAFLQFSSWAPDSDRFVFSVGENNRPYLGEVGETPQPLTETGPAMEVRWVDSDHFFFITNNGRGFELHLGTVGADSRTILGGTQATEHFPLYDFEIP